MQVQRVFPDSVAIREYVKTHFGNKVFLSFSRGKDALAAWIALREMDFEVVPFFRYGIPGLEFIDDSLDYYEKFFKCKIERYPQPSFYEQLMGMMYQPPHRYPVMQKHALYEFTYDDVASVLRRKHEMPNAYTATGVRAHDNMMRWTTIKKNGALNPDKKTFFPIFDWKIAEVEESIARAKVQLPVDYLLWGRTYDGIGWYYLDKIKENFPRDYQRILDWFPLADVEFFRRELTRRHNPHLKADGTK